jgi:hypothetical protein
MRGQHAVIRARILYLLACEAGKQKIGETLMQITNSHSLGFIFTLVNFLTLYYLMFPTMDIAGKKSI